MQTFLPYPSFYKSAACLDRARLGKQRLEVIQILRALARGTGWRHHPATKMWEQHAQLLCLYGTVICETWKARGYKDSIQPQIAEISKVDAWDRPQLSDNPWWLGLEKFHASHRSRLLDKNPSHYGQFGWTEQPGGPEVYFWPSKENPNAHH
jgi:hypothetical protein